jgi:hypothetical protein
MTTPRFIPICCGCNNVRDDSRRDERDPGMGNAGRVSHHPSSDKRRLSVDPYLLPVLFSSIFEIEP